MGLPSGATNEKENNKFHCKLPIKVTTKKQQLKSYSDFFRVQNVFKQGLKLLHADQAFSQVGVQESYGLQLFREN